MHVVEDDTFMMYFVPHLSSRDPAVVFWNLKIKSSEKPFLDVWIAHCYSLRMGFTPRTESLRCDRACHLFILYGTMRWEYIQKPSADGSLLRQVRIWLGTEPAQDASSQLDSF